MAFHPDDISEDETDPDLLVELIELADQSGRDLLPIAQSGGDVDAWVERFVKAHDLVYCVYQDPKRRHGHEAWILSGGHELLARGAGWNPKIGAIRVASQEAAEMMAAHHGDFRNSPFVTVPRLTHIVLMNGGETLNVFSTGSPEPRPLHRRVKDGTLDKAAVNVAERLRRERARKRRDRKRNG
ncbi:hypothetical protein FV226_25095 [Methylobacterium sp. WL12]|uniref:hypothetical protein n=1 Tax=Methylobacterium sp. WL12 TaxID=2603890 RepID=UPI0011CB2311|nr:hypothetical protein [Methylobacterium sp. WL12]TXM65378.1 hypothetical protein FV226_25095 [Methylobacterium sp. WL12]